MVENKIKLGGLGGNNHEIINHSESERVMQ